MNGQNASVKNMINLIIPFRRFQQGEAKEIFEEVQRTGTKIVVQNDVPSCVLLEPTKYEEMIETLEDYALYFEAERRNKDANAKKYSHDEICMHFGITAEELEKIEVEIE